MATKFGKKNSCPKCVNGDGGFCWGQLAVKLLRNTLWLLNLAGRTPDQSITHCWVKGHLGVSQGQPEVEYLGNPYWPPNFITRTPHQSATHCRGQRSRRGYKGSTTGQLLRNGEGHQCSQCRNCFLFWKSNFKMAFIWKRDYFDLLFTFFIYQGKVSKIPSTHISLTYIHTCILLTILTFFFLPY